MSRAPALLVSGMYSLAEKVAGMAFGLGTAMLLLRYFDKEEFATWGIFILIAYFVEMGRSGLLQNGLVRSLAARADSPGDEKAAIIGAALVLNLGFSVISNAIIALSAEWISTRYQVPALYQLLPMYYIANLVMAIGTHYYFVQQAFYEFRGVFWMAVFYRGVPFGWILLSIWQGGAITLPQMGAAFVAGAAGGSLATWWFARPFLVFGRRYDRDWIKNLASYGKFVLGTNLSTMIYKNIDKLTLSQLLGPAAFSIYDAAGRVTQLVEAPAFSIAAVVFPKSAEKMALEGASGVKNLYEKSVGATLAIILPFVLLVWVFAGPVIRVFAGEGYAEAAQVLRLTAFFGLFMPFAVQFGTLLDATGKPAVNFAYTFFTAVLNIVLSYVFIRQYGLYGAAFGTLTGYIVSFLLMQRLLYKEYGINALNAFRYIPWCYQTGWSMIKARFQH